MRESYMGVLADVDKESAKQTYVYDRNSLDGYFMS